MSDSATVVSRSVQDSFDLSDQDQTWLTTGESLVADQTPANSTWIENADGSYTIETVALDTTYSFPDNPDVSVTFTQLPENPGSVTIKEVTLNASEVEELGALSSTAYEITSSMEDGTFEYTLTLPNPTSANDAQIQYSEDGQNFEQVDGEQRQDGVISISGLDHFTVFVITSPPPAASNTIDNGDPGYSTDASGDWATWPTNGIDGDHDYVDNTTADRWARWTFSNAELPKNNVDYKIFLHWVVNDNRSTAVDYKLYNAAGVLKADLATVDQTKDATGTVQPDGTSSGWFDAGTHTVKNGWYVEVRTTGANDGHYIADAVQIMTAEAPAKVFVKDAWTGTALGTDLGGDQVFGYNAFATVQEGIDAVADGGEVVVRNGTYVEDITIDHPLTLRSKNGANKAALVGTGTTTVTVTSDDVTIDDFTITNSTGNYAIYSNNNSGLNVINNVITDVHSTSSNVHSVYIQSSSTGISDITIDGNTFSDIGYAGSGATGYSASAIFVGDSTGSNTVSNLTITNNSISNIRSTGPSYVRPESKGAYGILINNGAASTGMTYATITGNTISDLEGLWSHAIGLEGPTPDAVVMYNTISDAVDHKGSTDAIGVFFEANSYADSATVSFNSFATSVPIGVALHPSLTGETVNAIKNWWGDTSGPGGVGPGAGSAVGPDVEYCPWLTTSDLYSITPTFGGSCLSNIQGRTFIDRADNGLLLAADGDHPTNMQDDFTVRLYDASWNELGEQTTRTTANVGQYNFENLLDEDTLYRVCGVNRDDFIESVPSLGQAAVTVSGGALPSAFSDATIIANASGAGDEFSRCWETTLADGESGAYLGVGYELDAPELLSPADDAFVTGNPTQTWSAIDTADHYVYESFSDAGLTSPIYTTNVSGTSRTVGGNQTITFWWRVKAVDANGNESAWSDARKLNVDNTAPSVPGTPTATPSSPTNQTSQIWSWGGATDSLSGILGYYYRVWDGTSNVVASTFTTLTSAPTNLAEGIYTFFVKAVDNVGIMGGEVASASYEVDTTDPVVSVDDPSDGDFVSGTITPTGTVSDDNLLRYYFVVRNSSNSVVAGPGTVYHDGPVVNPSFSWDTTTVPDGDYTVHLAARDKADNRGPGSEDSVAIVVDNTDPIDPTPVSTSHTVSTWSNDDTIDVTWSGASDNLSGVDGFYTEWNTDPTTMTGPVVKEYEESDSSETSPSLADGTAHYFHIATVDNAGNWTATEHLGPFWIDTTAPDATGWTSSPFFTRLTDGAGGRVDMTFTENSDPNVDYYEYQYRRSNLNGSAPGTGILNMNTYGSGVSCVAGVCTWSPNFSDGAINVHRFRAVDLAGNQGAWSNWDGFNIATASPSDFEYDDFSNLTGIFSEASYIAANGGFAIREQIAPTSGITSPTGPAISSSSAQTISYTFDDVDTEVKKVELWYTFNGGVASLLSTDDFLTGSFTETLTDGDGEYCLYTIAEDVADDLTLDAGLGNRESKSSCEYELELDTTDPTSTIEVPTNSGDDSVVIINDWDGTVSGTASDSSGISRVELSIERDEDGFFWNGATWVAGSESTTRVIATGTETWTYTVADIDEDIYTVTSHAVDTAGNIEDSYNITIVYDVTIPEIALTIDPTDPDGNNDWYITEPTITLTATDNSDPIYGTEQIEYQWNSDSGTWTTTTSTSVSFNPPGEGSHILYYRALDKAGNYSDTGIKVVRWDSTPLTEGPRNFNVSPNPTSADRSTATWEEAEDNTGVDKYEINWKLDGTSTSYTKSLAPDIFETELDQLTEGTWKVTLTAFDSAGNSESVSKDLIVDKTAPGAPTLSLNGTGAGSATLGWTAVTDAVDYIIYYGTTSGQYLYAARVGNTTNYTVQGLGAGNYFFVVRAVDNANNQSANSNEVNTGQIGGAPGVLPGAPAEGFVPAGDVLGDTTDETLDLTEDQQNSEADGGLGSVLGDSTVGNWLIYHLPWILLLIQMLGLVIIELIISPDRKAFKLVLGVATTGVIAALFYFLSQTSVYPDGSILAFIAQWFYWLAVGILLGVKAVFLMIVG